MGGGTLGANTQTISKAKYEADKRARQYKREKLDEQTRAAQSNIGEASSDAMSSFEMGMEGIQEFVERNTRSLRPQDDNTPEVSDTVSTNYSKSSSEKSSQTKSKAKKKTGEGTGGSKAQFYAKK
jgi:hypothetical protein